MCYQWQVTKEEVTEKEWEQILQVRGQDLRTWYSSVRVIKTGILVMALVVSLL